ncbi:MAG: RtcB family protein [Actinomycetota bacterium]|nr:RtcB family protein [Actinomycetota bacterium]
MRVPGHIFASDALFDKAAEDHSLEQVANVATLPGIVGASYAMPDIHWGYGFPIGGVAATDITSGGAISPGGVGFDIGCGVRLLRSDLPWNQVRRRLPDLVRALGRQVPRGVGRKGRLQCNTWEIDRVLEEGVSFALSRGVGWEEDAEMTEDSGTLTGARPAFVSERAKERGAAQLGSLGAGNHFLEVQVVEQILDTPTAEAMRLWEGQVCLMIHSGSRGVGHQICTDHIKVFDRVMGELGIEVPDRQLACLPVEHELAQKYLGAMDAAGNFARANRHVLADAARAAFEETMRTGALEMGMTTVYDISHNLAKIETHEIDGGSRELCVHRKGATRAFGPNHPELPDRYMRFGQPVMVPGSMGTASYVLAGLEGARTRSFSSTCHGAGRLMSRTKARKVMDGHTLREQLRSQGILLAGSSSKQLSEEAPYAYKDVSEVVDVCEGAGLTKTVARLRPVGVVKG